MDFLIWLAADPEFWGAAMLYSATIYFVERR